MTPTQSFYQRQAHLRCKARLEVAHLHTNNQLLKHRHQMVTDCIRLLKNRLRKQILKPKLYTQFTSQAINTPT